MNEAIVVTGVAPLSLGEGIVHAILSSTGSQRYDSVILIDRIPNPSLEKLVGNRGAFVEEDLNPFKNRSGKKILFEDRMAEILEKSLKKIGADFIGTLINNAGIYDFGPVDELQYQSIENLLGVNALGHIGMLRAVMKVNRDRDNNNKKHLQLCEVGSFQGLMPRGGRSIYCFTKGGMIDFCQALANGELEHVVYIAPPSIDTPMLHLNHWAKKARGDETVWRTLYRKDLIAYQSIFLACDPSVAASYFKRFFPEKQQELQAVLKEYEKIRNQYMGAAEGVATVAESADTVVRHTFDPHKRSAIVFGKVINDTSGRQYREFVKDLLYGGAAPFSKRALMESK